MMPAKKARKSRTTTEPKPKRKSKKQIALDEAARLQILSSFSNVWGASNADGTYTLQ